MATRLNDIVVALLAAICLITCSRPTTADPPSTAELINVDLQALDYPHSAQLVGRVRNPSPSLSVVEVPIELSIEDCGRRALAQAVNPSFYRRLTESEERVLAKADTLDPKLGAEQRAALEELHRRKALQVNCETVEQQRVTLVRAVPPRQARDFQQPIAFPFLREATGQHFWAVRVLGK